MTDGASELARLAAMMAPKCNSLDARAQVAQAVAIQAAVGEELIRQREEIAREMDFHMLAELVQQFGIMNIDFVPRMDEDEFTDPLTGPALRRLHQIISSWEPFDLHPEDCVFDGFHAAINLAKSRTQLTMPEFGASLEDALRYAANVQQEDASWEVLEGAFRDFLLSYVQGNSIPPDLYQEEWKSRGPVASAFRLYVLECAAERAASYHKAFKPGQDAPLDIKEFENEFFFRIWRYGLHSASWRGRLGWLIVNFSPFWRRHSTAYTSIHQKAAKKAAAATAVISAQKKAAGEAGRQNREYARWKGITAKFVKFLEENPGSLTVDDIQERVVVFVDSSLSITGKQDRENTLEVLMTFCTAVSSKALEPKAVLDLLHRSKLTRIQRLKPEARQKHFARLTPNEMTEYESKGIIPPEWIQFKSLTEEAVSACIEDIKDALAKI